MVKARFFDHKNYLWWRILSPRPGLKNLCKVIVFFLLLAASGYGIIADSFSLKLCPPGLAASCTSLRNLFYYNLFATIAYPTVGLYVLSHFVKDVKDWTGKDGRFVGKNAVNVRNKLTCILQSRLGWVPVCAIAGLVAARRIGIYYGLFAPQWYARVEPPYYNWYVTADVFATFATATTFWLFFVLSTALYDVVSSNPINVEDMFSYKEGYKTVAEVARRNIIYASLLAGFFLASVTYWTYAASFQVTSILSLSLALATAVVTLLIFLLNSISVHHGIESSKSNKIRQIREQDRSGVKDLRVFSHMQASSWRMGFGFGETFMISLVTSEIATFSGAALDWFMRLHLFGR